MFCLISFESVKVYSYLSPLEQVLSFLDKFFNTLLGALSDPSDEVVASSMSRSFLVVSSWYIFVLSNI